MTQYRVTVTLGETESQKFWREYMSQGSSQETPDAPDLVGDVAAFADKFGFAYDGPARCLPTDLHQFRRRFMDEELREYDDASVGMQFDMGLENPTDEQLGKYLADQLDALLDLTYVVLGTAVMQFGEERVKEGWRRVHGPNMTKVRVTEDDLHLHPRRSLHDVVKPPGFVAPDHSDLVADHAHRSMSRPLTGSVSGWTPPQSVPKSTGVASTPRTTGVQSTRTPR